MPIWVISIPFYVPQLSTSPLIASPHSPTAGLRTSHTFENFVVNSSSMHGSSCRSPSLSSKLYLVSCLCSTCTIHEEIILSTFVDLCVDSLHLVLIHIDRQRKEMLHTTTKILTFLNTCNIQFICVAIQLLQMLLLFL